MFINRLFYVTVALALLIVTACAPQPTTTPLAPLPSSSPTPSAINSQTSEPTVAVSPTAALATATSAVTTAAKPSEFQVNGHSLYIQCIGSGSPTIVLETGEGGTISDVTHLQKMLAIRTTTCAYDRAIPGGLRPAQDVIDDLHALLAAAQVPGPYLLVGHSAGGMFVQLYARTFPDQVMGVVAMNPVPPAHPWLEEVNKVFTAQEYADEQSYY